MGYELWAHHLKHNPKNPNWKNRDRFVLSAGHGSMLIYSLLHLFGYDLGLNDLKEFRQWGSKTPGHPEYRHTVGVETTTGPLGTGVSTAVGMAVAEAHLGAVFNRDKFPVIDHHTFVLVSDGDLMEGVSAEALSFAGTQKLNKLILLYDSNDITIEGGTDLAFCEDVKGRMEAYGFKTFRVEDGNDREALTKAIESAKEITDRPSFIEVRTQIGFGSPLAGTNKAHSDAMGPEKAAQTRKALGWVNDTPFEVDDDVYEHYHELAKRGESLEEAWNDLFNEYIKTYPELKELWDQYFGGQYIDFLDDEGYWDFGKEAVATRSVSGKILNYVAGKVPNLIGGSADLAPSNKTTLEGYGSFNPGTREGRNLHFGVREHGMAAIVNGIALHGGLKAYGGTFFVFADFMKPMLRLASIQEIAPIFVLTHDSVGVGEDGPTHEPIEQLTMLRAQPNFTVFRPADARETAAGWLLALNGKRTPTALILSRQNLPQLEGSSKEAMKGAYIISKAEGEAQGIIIATGSEVQHGVKAQELLAGEGIHVNVVSMPSQELFDAQDEAYRESVLPSHLTKRLAVEAGATLGWYKYVGLKGKVHGLDRFGASAPAERIFEEFGFTGENVAHIYKTLK